MTDSDVQRRINQRADEYRAHIAHALHRATQQQLVNIFVCLRRIEDDWPHGTGSLGVDLELALAETRSAIDQLRTIVGDIYPAVLASGGLQAALETLALRLPFPLELTITTASLPTDLSRTTYFICAEFLGVLAKGGVTADANITTSSHNDLLTIEIRHSGGHASVGPDITPIEDRILAVGGHLHSSGTTTGARELIAHIPMDS